MIKQQKQKKTRSNVTAFNDLNQFQSQLVQKKTFHSYKPSEMFTRNLTPLEVENISPLKNGWVGRLTFAFPIGEPGNFSGAKC